MARKNERPPKVYFQLLIFLLLIFFSSFTKSQSFKTLKSFSTLVNNTNLDGANVQAILTPIGNVLYGTASGGGSNGSGTLFKINVDGTGFSVIKTFSKIVNSTNADGAQPLAPLTWNGNTLFGTTGVGGVKGAGSVFTLDTRSNTFLMINDLGLIYNGPTNAYLESSGGLISSNGTLFGTSVYGGLYNAGSVFSLSVDGSNFRVLKSFSTTVSNANSDGANPFAGLALLGDTLYGTTRFGGLYGCGVVFRLNTNGSNFSIIKTFPSISSSGTNAEGARSDGILTVSGDTLYGGTIVGGLFGGGTLFKLNTNGSGFSVLKNFQAASSTNISGADPSRTIVVSGNTIYGAAEYGGSNDNGVIYRINTDGSWFSIIKTFPPLVNSTNEDGAKLNAGLVLNGGTLFGITGRGGLYGQGVIFSLNLSPLITATYISNAISLNWTTIAGQTYQLQYKTNLAQTIWSNLGTSILATSNLLSVSDSFQLDSQRFYRIEVLQ